MGFERQISVFWDLATVTQSSVRHYETIIFATFMTIEFDPDKNGK